MIPVCNKLAIFATQNTLHHFQERATAPSCPCLWSPMQSSSLQKSVFLTSVCYVGQVRLLEAQNRKLADELDKLKTKWGKETAQIKAMFQAELDEARAALDEAEKEKARLEIKVASLEEQIEELRIK